MCLSVEAFALFLNLLPIDLVDAAPDRVVIAATSGDVHWVAVEERWCTMAPQLDHITES
ncbi:hypothetical protein [Tropicibacter naphthalenivorans]|uniref:Uncharacterized protein n=1 Tax=Tropicibacter naphthalenivorans TaxID=441103 RepID=A0A0P1GGB6_9RHOB|nr:hypothetical protein [Tropicibacter naphthalenivorans]CUH80911.1 hypothetical protein TRN7648_03228 [Tropicibacter naphthalenivorans]SMC91054.1 hypothetical protein SAMN04488093_106200 [Tropicibacter naphthalenivorans]